MRVLISGSTGLIGSALVRELKAHQYEVTRLVRASADMVEPTVVWDFREGEIEPSALDGFSIVVHLAGESIASSRWTADKKARIRDSRVVGTHRLAQALAQLDGPPDVLLCASATGFYGNRSDEVLDEDSEAGQGFLASVVQEWETAAEPARVAGIRIVHLRFGMVLSEHGGALGKMLRPFRLGLGGTIGGGAQYWAWIHLKDAVGAILHALSNSNLVGPTNIVAPQTTTNTDFTRALGWALRRPTLLPMPRFAVRWMLGEMADELLLASTRVRPTQLLNTGYVFQYPELREALAAVLE